MRKKLPNNHDVIHFYQKKDGAFWDDESIFTAYDKENLPDKTAIKYSHRDPDGRMYQLDNLINPNQNRPNLTYEFLGVSRVWRWTRERMTEAHRRGLVIQNRPGVVPRLKRYLDEQRGIPLSDVWPDIPPLNSQAQERLGYPTQKPQALLERIIQTSCPAGGVVLDPFCGCGTAVHAAEKLERRWIGIDITHLAISLIERRLKDAFQGITFDVQGTPKDFEGARDLAARDKNQFQWWAVSLVDAVPQGGVRKKGMDRGIDGIRWVRTGPKQTDVEQVVVSVKGGENVTSAMVRDLKGTVEREQAAAGLFVTLAEPTREMLREAAAAGFFETSFGRHPKIQIVTIRELPAGMKVGLPALGRGEGFRRAPRERGAGATQIGMDL